MSVGGLVPERERISHNLVKLRKGGEVFEVVLKDTDKALEFRQGKNIDMSDILETTKIFSDAKKGELQSSANCKKWLGISDPIEAAKVILQDGELALTQEQRKRFFEAKKNKIIEYIHMNASDPRTKLPHPKQRIELAIEQAKVQIDPYTPAEAQVEKVIAQLRPILPLNFEQMKIKVTISARYSSSAYVAIKSRFRLESENWTDDGSVKFELNAPAGMRPEIFNLINKLTKGDAVIEEVK